MSIVNQIQVHEKIGRSNKALELYQACKELPGADEELTALADEAAQRLQSGS